MKTRGQSMTESILLMPVFFLIVFGLLQLAQLGLAVVMTSYAASSIARIAAASTTISAVNGATSSISQYQTNAQNIMLPRMGINFKDLKGCIQATPPTATLTVRVRARVDAYPFFAQILSAALDDNYLDEPGGACDQQMVSPTGFGPFNFQGQTAPYYFYISGIARSRMNYTS